jgi:hypothetical protein
VKKDFAGDRKVISVEQMLEEIDGTTHAATPPVPTPPALEVVRPPPGAALPTAFVPGASVRVGRPTPTVHIDINWRLRASFRASQTPSASARRSPRLRSGSRTSTSTTRW